jgi:hypothetical protein
MSAERKDVWELDDVHELTTFIWPVTLPDMGGDGWRVEVPDGEPLTFSWGNGNYGIHVTRNSAEKRFGVEVNILYPEDHMNEALQKLAQVIDEQIGLAREDIRLRLDVTYRD